MIPVPPNLFSRRATPASGHKTQGAHTGAPPQPHSQINRSNIRGFHDTRTAYRPATDESFIGAERFFTAINNGLLRSCIVAPAAKRDLFKPARPSGFMIPEPRTRRRAAPTRRRSEARAGAHARCQAKKTSDRLPAGRSPFTLEKGRLLSHIPLFRICATCS
jgi:hypothetical protein